MLRGHTVAQVRDAEARLAEESGWDVLMQRAARGLADALADVPAGDLVLVLVGPGNNGGDALFAAAHLLDRGVRIDLCLLDESKAHAEGLAAARAAGARTVEAPSAQRWVVDGVFGIGARAGLDGRAAEWVDWVCRTRPHVVAVDVPSGVDVDTGTRPGVVMPADRVVTFGTRKTASFFGPLPTLVDIGLGPHLPEPAVESIQVGDGHLLADHLGPTSGHKYSRGVLGVIAGSDEFAGAAHLCIAGAQAGPVGMIRFEGSERVSGRVVDRAPEVVASTGQVQAWVVGPGTDDGVGRQLQLALGDDVPVVVDATALSHLPARFAVPALLTPHAGELARMLEVERQDVEADPLGHATRAAERWGATVLLKGQRTVVVRPDGRVRVNLSGTPWLGTAGSGDVLAGFAGSLLAAGLDPFDAGSLAAFLHGAAGVHANPGGPVVASDVAAVLPRVVADFLAGSLVDVLREDWA